MIYLNGKFIFKFIPLLIPINNNKKIKPKFISLFLYIYVEGGDNVVGKARINRNKNRG